ncbi:MAG: ATP-binding protein [Blastochloris sp.]|nr:ATP-binding protein [Blastochloris sp.]
MKRRFITPRVLEALADTPVVYVQGPRQAGKTTLVQNLREHGHEAEYFTMDDAVILAAAQSDADGFISGLPERVILDEVQRAPDLFRAIKRSVDTNRSPGRFLLTGSANALLLPQVSESLAGRMEILRLGPFSQGEIEGSEEGFLEACFSKEFQPGKFKGSEWSSLVSRILAGGFPEAVKRQESRRRAWFGSYVTTILERDVRDISNIQGLRELPHLLRLVAARSSNILNFNDLARDAGLPPTTVKRHWALLEAVFLGLTIDAWSGNLTSRLSKAPKLMVADSGLLCFLLGLESGRLKEDALMTGAVLETFVGLEISKQISWFPDQIRLFHYRTHNQQEVDYVLEDSAGNLVGIEVKKSASPSSSDFKGLRHLAEQVGEKFIRGILFYRGNESVSFGPGLHAVPVSALWGMEKGYGQTRSKRK